MAMTPGELLREARRRHGLSQRQLAARARTSQAAVSRIERGVVAPTIPTLAGLLRLMNEELALGAEPLEPGHDRTLIETNLGRTPAQRIDAAAAAADLVLELRTAAPGG
jgi:transcriptional regulator with XRE-family HTH domain